MNGAPHFIGARSALRHIACEISNRKRVTTQLSPQRIGRSLVLALLLCFGAAFGVRAQLTAPVPHRGTDIPPGDVIAVKVEGNQKLSSDELTTVTATKVTGFFSRFLYNIPFGVLKWAGAPYQKVDAATLSRDTATLNLYYKDHGFISATTK